MRYKDISDPGAKTRELRRMWEVEVFVGDPNVEKPKTKKETVVAWNAVGAIRAANGPVVAQPKALGFVTWPRANSNKDDIYFIENPSDGPTNKKAKPSIEIEDEDWNF